MQESIKDLTRHLPMLSLQNMSVIKIITTMCNNQPLLNLIIDMPGDFQNRLYAKTGKEFKAVQAMAHELISKICNCTILEEAILEFLWPVTYRIMLWKNIYAPSIRPTAFHWTYRGRIDNTKTAKCIIRNRNNPNKERFSLACKMCFSKEIREIWNEMTDDDRTYFQYGNHETFNPLFLFWIKTMTECYYEHVLSKPDVCEYAVEFGLMEAVKYIFSKLPNCLKNDIGILGNDHLKAKIKSTSYLEEDEVDIGYLLFSHIWKRNKLVSFHTNSVVTLLLVLHSSESESFLEELAERLPFVSNADIESFLHLLFYNYHSEVEKDHDYCKLFIDVWRMISASVRKSLTAKPNFGNHFLKVMIKSEFRYLLTEGIGESATCSAAPNTSVTPYCFDENNWEFLNFLIVEGISTIPSLQKHRSVLLNYLEEKGIQSLLEKSLNMCS